MKVPTSNPGAKRKDTLHDISNKRVLEKRLFWNTWHKKHIKPFWGLIFRLTLTAVKAHIVSFSKKAS